MGGDWPPGIVSQQRHHGLARGQGIKIENKLCDTFHATRSTCKRELEEVSPWSWHF